MALQTFEVRFKIKTETLARAIEIIDSLELPEEYQIDIIEVFKCEE